MKKTFSTFVFERNARAAFAATISSFMVCLAAIADPGGVADLAAGTYTIDCAAAYTVTADAVAAAEGLDIVKKGNGTVTAGAVMASFDGEIRIEDLKEYLAGRGIPVRTLTPALKLWQSLKKDKQGLVPAIVVEDATKEVLMLAYMDYEALEKTMEKTLMHYHSRSRNELWLKGETSGHYQHVKKACVDCDRDTLLFYVDQDGAACHTGNHSCFFTELDI